MLNYLTTNTLRETERPRASLALRVSGDATVEAIDPIWLVAVQKRINELLSMQENWDSYSAKRVDFETAMGALVFLLNNSMHDMPAPQIVPMSNGGIQIEWHLYQNNLELSFAPGESPTFFHSGADGELEGDIEQDMLRVESLLRGLPPRDEFVGHNR